MNNPIYDLIIKNVWGAAVNKCINLCFVHLLHTKHSNGLHYAYSFETTFYTLFKKCFEVTNLCSKKLMCDNTHLDRKKLVA